MINQALINLHKQYITQEHNIRSLFLISLFDFQPKQML